MNELNKAFEKIISEIYADFRAQYKPMEEEYKRLQDENTELREQLRWRKTDYEKPATGNLVLVQDTLQYMTTFVYHPELDDTFIRRRYWLPIPPVNEVRDE